MWIYAKLIQFVQNLNFKRLEKSSDHQFLKFFEYHNIIR